VKSQAAFPLFSVEIEQEEIELRTMIPPQVPDERWRYVDKKGHGHFWDGDQLPTLRWVITGTRWAGDEHESWEYDVGEYRCRQCGEVVEPKKITDYFPKPIMGPRTVTVTINDAKYRLSEEMYAKSVEAWRESIDKLTGGPIEISWRKGG
jgi:hypothetical protein